MVNSVRYIFLCIYTLVFLIAFWYAHRFLECVGFFCALLPTLAIWLVFIAATIFILILRPLSFGKAMIRFGLASVCSVCIYAFYYNVLMDDYGEDRWFIDYSLSGIMMTLGYTAVWLYPVKSIGNSQQNIMLDLK